MKRYFFHVQYGELFQDGEGTTLPDLKAAQRNAAELMGRMLIDESDGFWDKPNIAVTVTDADGLVLWTLDTVGCTAAAVMQKR